MRPLSATELIDVWEQGTRLPPLQQALLLLSVACPELNPDALAQASIGYRDALLLQLRAWTFGPHLDSVVDCPACGERLEFVLDSSEMLDDGSEASQTPQAIETADLRILVRAPNSLDLAAASRETDPAAARTALLARCIVEVQPLAANQDEAGTPPTPDALPDPTLAIVLQQLSVLDPQADVRLDLTCSACGHRWEALFDIVTYFWREIDDWAQRTPRDVHTLALAYGWSETDILNLSAWRRQSYLRMVTG